MMNDPGGIAVSSYAVGVIVGVLAALFIVYNVHGEVDQRSCELNLPRTEKCVLTFVPEKTVKDSK